VTGVYFRCDTPAGSRSAGGGDCGDPVERDFCNAGTYKSHWPKTFSSEEDRPFGRHACQKTVKRTIREENPTRKRRKKEEEILLKILKKTDEEDIRISNRQF
jgi:hypothetical protein